MGICSAAVLETNVALSSRCFVTKTILGMYVEGYFLELSVKLIFS